MANLMIDWFDSQSHVFINTLLPATVKNQLMAAASAHESLKGHIWLASSGTENFPKMIALSKVAMLASATAVNTHLKVAAGDAWLNILPLFHTGGLAIHARAAASNSTVIDLSEQKWEAERYVQQLQAHNIAFSSLTSTHVFDIVKLNLAAPRCLKAVIVGGGPLSKELHAKAYALGWPLLNSYGMTEMCSQIATAAVPQPQSDLIILNHIEMRFDKENFILLKSDALLTGFVHGNDPEKRFIDPKVEGWYTTQDKGALDGSVLKIFGRGVNFIKIGGENINFLELENAWENLKVKHHYLEDTVLIDLPDERLGNIICLATTGQKNSESLAFLVDEFRKAVIPIAKIRHICPVDYIPRTDLHKLKKNELRAAIGDPLSLKLTCTIPKETFSYQIVLQNGLLKDTAALQRFIKPLAAKFAVISDEIVAELYGKDLVRNLQSVGIDSSLFTFPCGERHKTRATKERLENALCEAGFGRDSGVIALGGGIVTDMGGFIAATYCRGIPLGVLPTSLLGMVDASIGGKTGVDTPYGKNLIGCTYQPKIIGIDTAVLQSLPLKEIQNGVVEMIKHGLIADRAYFDMLEQQSKELLALNSAVLKSAIFTSCHIKKSIVEEDEKESGKRHLLNFGHTIAHAIELLTDYAIPHGEAVAIGLLVEAHMAVQMGILQSDAFERIHAILKKYGLPLQLSTHFTLEVFQKAMSHDKKSLKGKPRFVLLQGIGMALPCDGKYCSAVPDDVLFNALTWMNHDLFGH